MYGRRSITNGNRRSGTYAAAVSSESPQRNRSATENLEEAGEVTKEEPLDHSAAIFIDESQYATETDGFTEEDAVQLREIGNHVARQKFTSNGEIINATPLLTRDIQAVSVLELINQLPPPADVRSTLAGLGVMTNRLIFENRYLLRELQALRKMSSRDALSQFDDLVFKKENVIRQHEFAESDGIPSICLNDFIHEFDSQSGSRRNETAMQTLRRFVKFLLEHIIPKRLHGKFTVRERGGYDHLTPIPLELTSVIKDICFETVNLYEVQSNEEVDRRNNLSETIFKFMKFALQELRRTPRKSKINVNRAHQ